MFKGLVNLFNLTAEKVSSQKEILDMVTYSVIGFAVYFFFKNPQELLYLIASTLLVLAALNIRGAKLIPVIILPSIGALLGSYVFHNSTFIIPLFIPLIWLGNIIIIFAFKFMYLERKINFFLTLFIGATTNYLFLLFSAYGFILLGLAPTVFLIPMGTMQLASSIFGGVIAFLIISIKIRK